MEKNKDNKAPQYKRVSVQETYVPKWKRNSMLRIYTGAALILGLVLAFFLRELSVYIFDAVLLIIIIICANDIMKVKQIRKSNMKEHYVFLYLVSAFAIFITGTLFDPAFTFWAHLVSQVIVLCVWSLYIFFMYYVDESLVRECRLKKKKLGRECRKNVVKYLGIIAYPAFLLYSLFALNHIGEAAPSEAKFGLFALLLVFAISCLTDTFAYMVGRTLGGPKLLPGKFRYISPNKTLSGSIGGIVGGVLGALILIYIFSSISEFSDFMTVKIGDATMVIIVFAAIGIVGSIMTQAGDIYASFIKRKLGIKDFGKYLPGHGGAMDRLDGISFNAVFIFIVMMIIAFIC